MTPLIHKEIRLLVPAWLAVLLLAAGLPWISSGEYDGGNSFAAVGLFFGMVILAVGSFGREFSLGTFVSQMAQPVDRRRIWRTKIGVLLLGAGVIFTGYWVSSELYLRHELLNPNPYLNPAFRILALQNFRQCMLVSGAAMLVALAGGLWTTLLLRQTAAAFWTTFLAPAGLLLAVIFLLPARLPGESAEVVLLGAAGLYVLAGFWLAHRLFNRAQDAAWTGGIIDFSSWRYFETGVANAVSQRRRHPITALVKKEFQLQSVSFICAAALLALHLVVIVMRKVHGPFVGDSMAGMVSEFFWAVWLVLPLISSSTTVAEERRLGVVEAQFSLPVSRRLQFALKFFPAICFGVLLGGVLPWGVEGLAAHWGAPNTEFFPSSHTLAPGQGFAMVGFALALAFAGFYASTLARNFLQALGLAVVTFVVGSLFFLACAYRWRSFLGLPLNPPLTLGVAMLVSLALFPVLSYANFKYYQERGRAWRRNVIGLVGAGVFVFVFSAALYNRAWEIIEPAEPAHGPARFSLTAPPQIHSEFYDDYLLVQLPDGRVWFDVLGLKETSHFLRDWIRMTVNPFPISLGPRQFFPGSNWVSVLETVSQPADGSRFPRLQTIGVQSDGSLWGSDKATLSPFDAGRVERFGAETNWRAVSVSVSGGLELLLKRDGSLWGCNVTNGSWPGLSEFSPHRIGTDSDWVELAYNGDYARKADGSVWTHGVQRATNFDRVDFQKSPEFHGQAMDAYVCLDGSLRLITHERQVNSGAGRSMVWEYTPLRAGGGTNWVTVIPSGGMGWLVALKSDGTLWQWGNSGKSMRDRMRTGVVDYSSADPTQLGIHHDWVALAEVRSGLVTLAADGSLWLWPYRANYEFEPQPPLLKLPKQPEFLGNVLAAK